ncbi:DNA-3-methyladenine glycosylase [Borrelia miyamotoi]|uniref:Putative 3-methyladenine DNA glycosylase n=1 Tax=Borrelia miyamotoi TaxID=47466 RepID=A0AAX3JN23_9SPIR|nr:DNA-3-methyladenine glycosylase [Borrelia miyamotoi]QFP41920.1 DNA-3-methyladenine glycosylase [Borrelia miyamotoi]QFP48039.1 DNA-3-methyladenine glycosylase [Borrelia miyamotoi]QGT55797.1 DNA-3-methyladenine glycosylase [Borrelia miyamotoi]QGT56577.1 DNA-3-methyladenine glycosylase [Borrelia miyamotoi]WAZ71825.1 DNA-3-methyladenine glycosylase [Borrelia miyamotoi]
MNREFFMQDAVIVAKSLLGHLLVRNINGKEIISRIVETEAYMGLIDKACHSYGGRRTVRTSAMYNIGGYAYVYMIYGMHYMLNVVASNEHNPHAVLIRGVEPILPSMKVAAILTNGPGKLTKFLNIDLKFNKVDLINNCELFLRRGLSFDFEVLSSKRINVDYAGEEYASKLWRFYIKNNKFVSKY